jgi:phosphatidate cytidylyltransferase
VLTYGLASVGPIKHNLADAAVLVFGVLYVPFLLGHLLLTRAWVDGEFLVFFVVLVTWAADTGAYYSGTLFGRRRLAPVISPNKTVEGLVGGLGLALLAALTARAWFLPSFSIADCIATGLLLAVAGTCGDLAESAMKRSADVKDSGWLLPAHGGVLDRLDSMLFTAPAFYYYMVLVKG